MSDDVELDPETWMQIQVAAETMFWSPANLRAEIVRLRLLLVQPDA